MFYVAIFVLFFGASSFLFLYGRRQVQSRLKPLEDDAFKIGEEYGLCTMAQRIKNEPKFTMSSASKDTFLLAENVLERLSLGLNPNPFSLTKCVDRSVALSNSNHTEVTQGLMVSAGFSAALVLILWALKKNPAEVKTNVEYKKMFTPWDVPVKGYSAYENKETELEKLLTKAQEKDVTFPDHFYCPISKQLITRPVCFSGEEAIYDCKSVLEYLKTMKAQNPNPKEPVSILLGTILDGNMTLNRHHIQEGDMINFIQSQLKEIQESEIKAEDKTQASTLRHRP